MQTVRRRSKLELCGAPVISFDVVRVDAGGRADQTRCSGAKKYARCCQEQTAARLVLSGWARLSICACTRDGYGNLDSTLEKEATADGDMAIMRSEASFWNSSDPTSFHAAGVSNVPCALPSKQKNERHFLGVKRIHAASSSMLQTRSRLQYATWWEPTER